MRDVIVSTYN